MRILARPIRRLLVVGVTTVLVGQLGAVVAHAADSTDWRTELAKVAAITPTQYTRDAKTAVADSALIQPYVGDDLGESRLEPILADLDTRYFDGARFKSPDDAATAFDNLQHLESYLKGQLSGNTRTGDARRAYLDALIATQTGVRLLAEAAIEDAEATVGPFRASPSPAPVPAGVTEGFADIDTARAEFDKASAMLRAGNIEPATVHSASAWVHGYAVLSRLGITYTGDHDSDGVVDVVELRFGASPLLVDSDFDGLTDKFEIEKLTGFTKANNADTDADGVRDGDEDIDGDGLTNLREQELGTSPTNSDTDGDGVSDGVEVDRGTNPLVADPRPGPPLGGGAPPIDPQPTLTDTDGDGLIDSVEVDEETDPSNVDTDGDGLSDGAEVNDEWGTDPLNPDTDGDGLRDDYESAHIDDLGLDPGRPDVQVSKWSYVTDFLLGMFAGDFVPVDSMAWLAGNLCSGGLSAIPVVGWILGGLADLRDTIAGLIHGDWVSAGLSILGVVPYVGDAVAIPGKAARFVIKYTHRLMETLRFVTKWDKIPDFVKDLALQLILGETYDLLQGDGAAAAADGTAAAADAAVMSPAALPMFRFSKTGIRLMSKGDRTDWDRITKALTSPHHVDGDRVPLSFNWRQSEDYLTNTLLQGRSGIAQRDFPMSGIPNPRSRNRVVDFAESTQDGLVLHEVKTGVTNRKSDVDQCKKDAWLASAANPDNTPGNPNRVARAHWHFFPHGRFNSIGPSQDLLDCLITNGINFTIHAPNV